MADLITAGKLCKEEREKRGLSREELHRITKIPVDIIRRLEEDEDYLKKDPYAYFLMKVLVNYYGLEVEISRESKPSEEKKKEQTEQIEEKQGFFFRFFKAVFVFLVLFVAGFAGISGKKEKEDNFELFLQAVSFPYPQPDSFEIEYIKEEKGTKSISLKAKDYVWLTAYIDGQEKVIKLKKGQRVKLTFKDKIKFETIGNAYNLVIMFDNKKVAFEKKVIHNLFVDKEGVFFNGYNLVKGES
ncbi:helix-turn-helix domain-containing protein [Persephonella sp.]